MDDKNVARRRWTEEEILLGLYLYFQLPFGQLHSQNPEIKKLAKALGRSNSSVSMKLCNFASLDPKITESGRKGLAGASALDRAIYAEFSQNWNGLVARSEEIWETQVDHTPTERPNIEKQAKNAEFVFEPYEGASTAQTLTTTRIGQDFFRRSVIANYDEQCCITGIADPRLLIASHIVPWSKDTENRHNPANGLLLSATFDRAFDRGLISVDQKRQIRISRQLLESKNQQTRDFFASYEQVTLRPAIRFDPDPAFLEWHFKNCFLDQ